MPIETSPKSDESTIEILKGIFLVLLCNKCCALALLYILRLNLEEVSCDD